MTRDELRVYGRRITFVAVTLAIAWGALFAYCMLTFLQSPLHPEARSGNTIPWSNHGFTHYITGFDVGLLDGVFWAAPAIIAVGFLGLALYRGRQMFNGR